MSRGVCIVTGGAGFIGCALSRDLAARYDRVIAIDSLHPQVHRTRTRPAALDAGVELVIGDVTEAATWDSLLRGVRPEVVIHLAAETGTGQSLEATERHAHTNGCGTAVMLDGLRRHDRLPAKIVLCSSRAIYGEGAWSAGEGGAVAYPGIRTRVQLEAAEWDFPGLRHMPSTASVTHPAPVSVYGATKLAQEHMLSAWAAAFDVDVTILRLQNVYGPGQSLSNPYTGIVSLFCRLARGGESIPLYEDGRMLRDFVFIDDVAAAVLAALAAPGRAGTPLDIGTGTPSTIAGVAQRIASIYKAPDPHVCGRFRFGDVRHASCRIDAASARLGWTPRHGLEDGLLALSRWIEAELQGATVERR